MDMPMKYRPNRGGLEESMKEIKEFDSIHQLAAHLECAVVDISIEPYYVYLDERTGWPATCIVYKQLYVPGFNPGSKLKSIRHIMGFTDSITFDKSIRL